MEIVYKVENIDNQIANPNDYMMIENDDYTNSLKIFKELTGLKKYFTNEFGQYFSINAFTATLIAFKELVEEDFEISDIIGKTDEKDWIFEFKINNQTCKIILSPQDEDDFITPFMNQLNQLIELHSNTNKQLKVVMAHSQKYSDEYFDICLISDEVFNILLNHSPKYANQY